MQVLYNVCCIIMIYHDNSPSSACRGGGDWFLVDVNNNNNIIIVITHITIVVVINVISDNIGIVVCKSPSAFVKNRPTPRGRRRRSSGRTLNPTRAHTHTRAAIILFLVYAFCYYYNEYNIILISSRLHRNH